MFGVNFVDKTNVRTTTVGEWSDSYTLKDLDAATEYIVTLTPASITREGKSESATINTLARSRFYHVFYYFYYYYYMYFYYYCQGCESSAI